MRLQSHLLCGLWGLGVFCSVVAGFGHHGRPLDHRGSHHRKRSFSPEAVDSASRLLSRRDTVASGPVQLFNASELTFFSTDCANALGQPLDCTPTLGYSEGLYVWGGLTLDDLTALCTTACSESIASFRDTVLTACSQDVYTDEPYNATGYVEGTGITNDIYNVQGVSVKPIALGPFLISLSEISADMNPSEDPPNFCYALTANGTQNSTSVDLCGNCGIGLLRAQLEDPVMYNEALVSDYSAMVQSCSMTADGLTSPTPVFLSDPNTIVANISATPTCTGSYVVVPTGSTCDGFAEANSIATDQLLALNGLIGGCVNWPGNLTSLCVQNNCDPYIVQQNDTCLTVAATHNITLTQLLSWNPSIDPICANWANQIGHVICVGNPVGYVEPTDTYITPTTVTTAVPIPTNAMNGSQPDCAQWYNVSAGDYCSMITVKYGITLNDFYFLNPEIDANCTNLWAGQSYCVQAVGDISQYPGYLTITPTPTASIPYVTNTSFAWSDLPTATPITYNITSTVSSYPLASGSLENCFEELDNNYGNIRCYEAASLFEVSVANFIIWNPSVLNGQNYSVTGCTLQNETRYCGSYYNQSHVYYGMSDSNTTTSISTAAPTSSSATSTGPPGPTQTGVVANCQQWYVARAGDTCYDIAATYGITLDEFYAWNPAVGSDCSGLQASDAYCVMAPATSSTTIPATTTTTSVTPPAPTQAGIPSNCNAYAVTQSGDGCQVFADRNGITLAELYEWNPVLNNNCENFWLGEAYCIGVSS
ncbi:hypothetical protein CNMCM5793_004682 [Aspergillus hiratsukae]|uniref:LysM domain-containing protein n=1 Tax=Aspergillus hiratsukae TaxID=1194566 RepID=A0A8H6UG59_9EURO|nr:hypothetical protein CNMCM5793_004682 [Aspergillus hiratsukae]